MSHPAFKKDELAIMYTSDGKRHNIEIVQIVNKPVYESDARAVIGFLGQFATEVDANNLHKLPTSIKRAINLTN